MTIEEELVGVLLENKLTISTAESCTGGMIASRIVSVSGASEVMKIGFVTYANEAKEKYLAVSSDTICKYTVVSEQVAKEMAIGLKKETECDIAVATTGIAGPLGGTEDNPVGTVYIAIAKASKVIVNRFVFDGDRQEIREKASEKAMEMVLRQVL